MNCSVCGTGSELASGKKYCKRCHANYQKAHYAKNKAYYREKARAKEKLIQSIIKAKKESTPCMDCGRMYPSYVMDYDHRGDKLYNIAKMARVGSLKKLAVEMAKCDIVCSNCHRERTWGCSSNG